MVSVVSRRSRSGYCRGLDGTNNRARCFKWLTFYENEIYPGQDLSYASSTMRTILVRVAWGWLMLRATWTLAAAGPLLETLTGTSPEFVVSSWQMQQGLPSDRVRTVLQTRDSYVWVATFNGAARFDGVRFRVFNDANTPALRNSQINCLFEDAEGRLWFGNDTGEITWRDATGFHALAVTNNWPSSPIDRFAQGGDGTLWVLDRGGFILFVRNLRAEGVLGDMAGPLYSDIARDTDGQVWAVRYGSLLAQLAEGKAVFTEQAPRLPGISYRTIAAARQGGLWVRDGNRLRRWHQGKWAEDRGNHPWGSQTGGGPVRDRQRRGVGGHARRRRFHGGRRRFGTSHQSRDRAGP